MQWSKLQNNLFRPSLQLPTSLQVQGRGKQAISTVYSFMHYVMLCFKLFTLLDLEERITYVNWKYFLKHDDYSNGNFYDALHVCILLSTILLYNLSSSVAIPISIPSLIGKAQQEQVRNKKNDSIKVIKICFLRKLNQSNMLIHIFIHLSVRNFTLRHYKNSFMH